MKRIGLVFGLLVLSLWGVVFSAHGFYVLDDKLFITGYIQNQSSYRVAEGADELVSSENRLQMEIDAKLHPQVKVHGVFRGIYDGIYDLRHESDRWGRNYAGSRDKLSTEYKIRELYMDATLGRCDFRVGKQQVVWGETDGLRLMDIINPLDMRRQFITRDWEDIRIPQLIAKAIYGIDPMRNAFFELLWNPGDLERDEIYFDTTMNDDYKSPWTISNSPSLEGLKPLRQAGLVDVTEKDTSEINADESEFGARFGMELGGWFFTLNYWQGFSKSPVLDGDLTVLEPMFLGIGPPPRLPVRLEYKYPREKVSGFTFNKAIGLWVWRGEFATYWDKHYNNIDTSPVLGLPKLSMVDETLQSSMLGFDYKRFIKWLNPEKMFFISGQVFHNHIFNYDDDLRSGPYSQKPREDSVALTFLANTGYHMDRICPEVLVVYDIATTGWYIKPRLEFKYGEHWRPELGGLVFTGDEYELPFGAYKHNDEIYFRLKYQF